MAGDDSTTAAALHYLPGNRPPRITSAACGHLSTKENCMTAIATSLDRSTFLRRVLLVDAATCIVTGAVLAIARAPLESMLDLPVALLLYSGVSLFPCAALMFWVGVREPLARAAARLVVVGNALWVLGSAAVLVAYSPTALGYAFVIAQAVAVALLAELEYVGLRRV
jgi:hypothetical protein